MSASMTGGWWSCLRRERPTRRRRQWTWLVALTGALLCANGGAEVTRVLDHRMAAWHRTMVAVSERVPNSNVSTYMREGKTYGQTNVLARFAPRLAADENTLGATRAADTRVEDFPGGVAAAFRMGAVSVRTEIAPLFRGRDSEEWEGAALYTVSTDPPTAVVVGIGGQGVQEFAPSPDLERDELPPLRDLQVDGAVATYICGREDLSVCVIGDGELVSLEADEKDASGRTANASPGAVGYLFAGGAGRVVLAYAQTRERARALAQLDPAIAHAEVAQYYDTLLRNRVSTPEPSIDAAFRSALYTLEYNWVAPYGWNECIHHWLALWHNQHTAGAEWIGQADRSRLCTLTHAEQLLPDGAVPQFFPNGETHRDFGGSNQFWTWQARHYWKFTADSEFAAAAAPALDRVLRQTLREHDRDGNLLVGWGLQIGNQEDFVQFDHDGATPSIELANMMRTRAELAEALGDPTSAAYWSAGVRQTIDGLRSRLWLPDLGRFASYVDEHGKPRLDAQYHTHLYASLWDVVDERDGYASLRHVADRLTGAGGEVYCSNNFPNHTPGTWGMQAGAAQQPWAAWAFSKAGWRNETFRPLKAVSDWVMDPNHRGAWPEIASEPAPAYFTPPAGLFIAAVCEALFGLQVDAPAGTLTVAPSFPDHWPSASLNVAEYSAAYRRDGNRIEYTVTSKAPLKRRVRWSLPPSRVASVEVNGQSTPFAAKPGLDQTVVTFDTAPDTETRFAIAYEPLGYGVEHPASIAEGEEIRLRLEGLNLTGVDDRFGVLQSYRATDPFTLSGRVRTGLLGPYMRYGRLGLLNFARRTLFLECVASDGTPVTLPIDLTVLPRVEAAPEGELTAGERSMRLTLLVRNNTETAIAGVAALRLARHHIPFDVAIAPRSEERALLDLTGPVCGLLSVGDNKASLLLPDGSTAPLAVTLSGGALKQVEALRAFHASRLRPVPLAHEDLSGHSDWVELRAASHGGPCPWLGWQHPMGRMTDQSSLTVDALPGVPFEFEPQKMVFIGARIGRPGYRVELNSAECKKVYLLLATFADNHDMFTPLGHITLRDDRGVVTARSLCIPGDVDWWEPQGMGNTMGTAREERSDRHGLLPLLPSGAADWEEGSPPAFPQPSFWAGCLPVRTPDCTFSVVELGLDEPHAIGSVDIETVGVDPGFGLLAVAVETVGGMETLEGTPWLPEPEYREPRRVFSLKSDGDVAGWEFEGDAFSFDSGGALFASRSLHSLARGEQAVGTATSPVFRLHPDEKTLEFAVQGGHNRRVAGEDVLCIQLIDADTGAVLGVTPPPGTHRILTERMPVGDVAGRALRLRLVDGNTDSSYAWIGLTEVRALPAQ